MINTTFINSILNTHGYCSSVISCNAFFINSKLVTPKSCFIGLAGAKVDGNAFYQEALDRGASILILNITYKEEVLQKINSTDTAVFFVEDTKAALIALATAWRKKLLHIPIIAITGSAGKTTTKEMIRKMCTDAGAHVLATENSENGSIGLPLTLLRLKENHDAAIIEVGIQKPGEMDILIAILQKVKLSVITTILLAHEEHFCNKETVILEKTKLQLITEEKIIVPEEIKSYIHPRLYTILLGCSEKSDYQYQSHPMNISIFNAKTQKEFSVQSIYHTGYHHCLANAFACGLELGYRPKDIIHSLETFKRVPGRFSIHTLQNGGIIINDAYNAAHLTVMEKSIESFIFFPTNKKKVLVIGDMLEQGSSEVHNHTTIFEKVNSLENFFELAFFVGPRFKQNEAKNNNNKIQFANSIDEIKDTINTLCNTNHCMFFKSSRSMALFNYVTNYLNNNEK